MLRLWQIGILAILAWSAAVAVAEETPVAQLGEEPVYADEYAWYEGRLRTEVAARLMRQHGVAMAPDFWTMPLDGIPPEETLRRETLSRIARSRVVQQLAVGHQLVERVKTYRELLADFHEENCRRREMKAAGQVFYGPVQFRQDVWFDVWMEQLVRALDKNHAGAAAAIQAGTNDLIDQLAK